VFFFVILCVEWKQLRCFGEEEEVSGFFFFLYLEEEDGVEKFVG